MKAAKLIKWLQEKVEKYGDVDVDMITETEKSGQVEQPVSDIAYSPEEKRIKLLPENF